MGFCTYTAYRLPNLAAFLPLSLRPDYDKLGLGCINTQECYIISAKMRRMSIFPVPAARSFFLRRLPRSNIMITASSHPPSSFEAWARIASLMIFRSISTSRESFTGLFVLLAHRPRVVAEASCPFSFAIFLRDKPRRPVDAGRPVNPYHFDDGMSIAEAEAAAGDRPFTMVLWVLFASGRIPSAASRYLLLEYYVSF